jgi:hypothetical protein
MDRRWHTHTELVAAKFNVEDSLYALAVAHYAMGRKKDKSGDPLAG